MTYEIMEAIERNFHQTWLSALACSLIWAEILVRVDIIVRSRMSAN